MMHVHLLPTICLLSRTSNLVGSHLLKHETVLGHREGSLVMRVKWFLHEVTCGQPYRHGCVRGNSVVRCVGRHASGGYGTFISMSVACNGNVLRGRAWRTLGGGRKRGRCSDEANVEAIILTYVRWTLWEGWTPP